ncbi:hypothetical protein NW762_011581 [Fusarium torreyae]|uniref:Uncharacterized protein n=1 Tax=Fusarium torreyae TaxID=1237075 RepID=A0A9W8RSQ2_9HYPO|nr:hypothetical protein NW762_011581 [Fusarium torreyae]
MASPVAPPPQGNPITGSNVQPEDMPAVRVRNKGTALVKLPDGSSKNVDIDSGTLGYLVRQEGNLCDVEIINKTNQRAVCKIPRNQLDVGKPNSQFVVELPRLQQASQISQVSNQRAKDPAGKALTLIWNDLQKNLSLLGELGLRSDVYEGILNNPSEKQRVLNALIGSFGNKAWEALNAPELPLDAFRNLPRITSKEPILKPNQGLIYLRLYVEGSRFAKYGGKTTQQVPFNRQREHEGCIRDTANNSPHYREARRYSAANRHAIPVMLLTNAGSNVVALAETMLCCLLRTWDANVVHISQVTIHEALAAGAQQAIQHRMLLSALANITDNALRRANYPIFRGIGCNWNLPLQEGFKDRREWIRYRVSTDSNRSMLVYRWQSTVTSISQGRGETSLGARVIFFSKYDKATSGQKWHGFALAQALEGLPGIKQGQPLMISIELMDDGKPHPKPWYRGPYHGAWSNSDELHSFGIKVEWKDEERGQWYTYPLEPSRVLGPFTDTPGEAAVTVSWRKATCILQFLHNRRYRNPPHYLQASFNPNIKEVVYDHLSQSLTFQQVPETVIAPPSLVSFDQNVRALGKASETIWPELNVGNMPPPSWFGRVGPGHHSSACLLCMIVRRLNQALVVGCAKREGNFNVEASEPHRDRILQGSCRLCWEYFRRPCVWAKLTFGRNPAKAQNAADVFLPVGYEGAGIRDKYDGPAIPIEAPMTLDMYQQFEGPIDGLDSLMNFDDGED